MKPTAHWTDDAELLDLFVLNRLAEAKKRELESHLHECEQCRTVVHRERELLTAARRVGRRELKKRIKARLANEPSGRPTRWQILSAAAMVLLIVGVGVISYRLNWMGIRPTEQTIEFNEAPLADIQEQEVEEKEVPRLNEEMKRSVPPPKALEFKEDRSPVLRKEILRDEMRPAERQRKEIMPEAVWLEGYAVVSPSEDLIKNKIAVETDRADAMKAEARNRQLPTAQTGIISGMREAFRIEQFPLDSLPPGAKAPAKTGRSLLARLEKRNGQTILTLYLDTLLTPSEIETVLLDRIGIDSLLLHLPHSTIGFRLPQGWPVQ